ncbi:unnamed protein product [Prorocentrum cordatum]|uniref:Uncharacterized protein n=1 Tax=Prorocentrum cordatum TaxID=2364126 RepID=A0ABN9WDF7_9DINO|nr:unnamed protein product [Polarella glacialis]
MLKEGAAAERLLADTERQAKKQERDEERQLAQLDKQIRRMKESEFDAQATLDWKSKARKAENMARVRAREEEKMEAHEKWLAQQELRQAARAVQEERELKRAYRQQRNAAEAEFTSKLWTQADELRSTAEKSATLLPREEVLKLLDIPDDTLTEMKHTISRMAHDAVVFDRPAYNAQFAERLEAIRFKVAGAAAAMEEAVQHKAHDFINSTNATDAYDDQQYLMRLAWFLNDMKDEVRALHDKTTGVGKRIQSWDIRNPEKMSLTMSLALDGVTDNIEFRNKFLRIDTAKLAYSNTTQACDALAYMFASNIHPAYESLAHMKDVLDNMSLVVNSVFHDDPPNVAATMTNSTHALLNMAYAQNLAYKNTAQMLMSELVPSVMDRFHCESSGSSASSASLALAVLAAVAGWVSL